jgi:hypothetical protein
MSLADLPVRGRPTWDWLSFEYASAFLLWLALLAGLLTLAAVATMRVDCRVEQEILTSDTGVLLTDESGNLLVTGREEKRCDLMVGATRVPWLRWVQPFAL